MSIKIYLNGRKRKIGLKGMPNCRILKTEIRADGREWSFHVTKGWRSRYLA